MTPDRDHENEIGTIEKEQLSTADIAGHSDNASTASLARDAEHSQNDQDDRLNKNAGPSDSASPQPETAEPLFPASESKELRDRWHAIQAAFVDEPRKAVEDADGLVATAIKRLAESFAKERDKLEAQWDRGDDVSTEDLRVALRRYRSFFDRLLSI